MDLHPPGDVEPHLCLFCRDPPSLYHKDLHSPGDVVNIEYPRPLGGERIKVLGSCRDLLCISKANDRDVAIWNPFTGDHELLPPEDTQIHGGLVRSVCVNGFGYDDENGNCVLVRLIQTLEERIESRLSIYRSGANAWRRLQEIEIPYYLDLMDKRGVFVHGHARVHWIMRREWALNSAKVLVAFDFHANNFVEVDQLNLIDNKRDMDLTVLGGCLCLIIYDAPKGVDVWIKREYGLNGPWIQLFSIAEYPRDMGLLRPLAFSQVGDRVLVVVGGENPTLVWCDLRIDAVDEFDVGDMPGFFDAEICLRAHVPADG
ncbi:F-box protein CPR1-like [Eucalyptus grandis]|uniref:F-box protein CPR1-like n=1 Tax=Eucalyptus grandis TaxID=71139 RepID=UPI00192E82F1|nr:F-box protein CPR1-like [Eucalyptus grandis]XP_039160673.1 F-box protein CPR1-like [Eucalyptus grandis]